MSQISDAKIKEELMNFEKTIPEICSIKQRNIFDSFSLQTETVLNFSFMGVRQKEKKIQDAFQKLDVIISMREDEEENIGGDKKEDIGEIKEKKMEVEKDGKLVEHVKNENTVQDMVANKMEKIGE